MYGETHFITYIVSAAALVTLVVYSSCQVKHIGFNAHFMAYFVAFVR